MDKLLPDFGLDSAVPLLCYTYKWFSCLFSLLHTSFHLDLLCMSKYSVVYCQNVAYCYIYIALLIYENRSSNCMASGDLNVTCIAMFKASVFILRLHCRAVRVWKLSSMAFWSFHLSWLCENTDSESNGSAALFSLEGCRTKLEFKCVGHVNGCNKIV